MPSHCCSDQLTTYISTAARFCVAALLSSKFLDLGLQWQGMAPETIAARNGHKRVAQIIMVSGCGYLLSI